MAKPTLSEISKLFKTDDKPTDFHYYGTVVSADTDNRTYEVSINRDKNITVEAARLVGAHVGDTVMVTVMANGYATVTGRVGGDTDASDAQRKADGASDIADKARAKAVSALSKATAAEQLATQAEQNAKRSADAAELAEQNARNSADYASESKTASEQAQQAAETAQQNAADSKTAAETAQQNAADSQTAAEAARDRAATAEGYADTAQKQAAKAEKEASAANSYAVGALNSLSTTQDIMGVLSWVEESIKYVWDYPPTVEGKEYDPSKQYYTVIGKRVINPVETDYDKYYVLDSESEPASKSGTVATFDSFAEKLPLNKLTAVINPKQDLHGYDKPWVGGAGKNKVDEDILVNGNYDHEGSEYSLNVVTHGFISIKSGQTYMWSQSGKVAGRYVRFYDANNVEQDTSTRLSQYDAINATFSAPSWAVYIRLMWYSPNGITVSDIKALKPQIEEGNTATPWTPYSNICPISGWESVSATRSGKNLIRATYGEQVPLYLPKETTITASCADISGNPNINYYRKDGTRIDYWTLYDIANSRRHKTFTLEEDAYYFTFWGNESTDYQIELGSTATDYEPYQADTYSTDLPETVYGGTLDVVNGVLTVDRAIVDLGTLNWTYDGTSFAYGFFTSSVLSTRKAGSLANAICSNYAVNKKGRYSLGGANGQIASFNETNANAVCVRDDAYTSASDFKSAMSGVQLCYELAEPRTIQLTPKQVTTLLGENNVWADSGEVTVEYWDGPVGYVTPTSSFDSTETYYTVKGSPVKIDESKQDEHGKGLYYVHDLTNAKEAMADFIKAHLALTGEGLYVLKGLNDWRVLVANDGVYIIDPQGRRVASYKDSITLGTSEGNSIRITSEAITFNIGDKTFAYVAQDKWFASNAEVSGAMYIGDYSLRQKSNGDFVLGRRR